MNSPVRRRPGRLIAAAVFGFSLSAPPLAAGPVKDAHVEAELVAEAASLQPGRPFWAALRLKMDEGWHTYWKDPGDAGLATSIVWRLPEGFSAGPLEWPEPKTFYTTPEAMSYGYEGEVFLLARIEAPEGLTSGDRVKIEARAEWLSCREICVPGAADLTLELPVVAEMPAPHPRWAEPIARTLEQLPDES